MGKEEAIKLFEQKQVRSIWDEEHEKWYFSIVDVVVILTESIDVQAGILEKVKAATKTRRKSNRDELSRFENGCG